MKKILSLAALTALAACDIPATPIVSDFNGDSVTIVTSSFTNRKEALAASTAEAQRICEKGHKKRAEYVSTRGNPNTYENADLFLCLN
jgi:hypothetical protein